MANLSKTKHQEQLEFIASTLEHWVNFAKYTRQKEGLTTDDDTNIIFPPPHWPTVGTLKSWVAVLRNKK